MKKILFALVLVISTLTMNAQVYPPVSGLGASSTGIPITTVQANGGQLFVWDGVNQWIPYNLEAGTGISIDTTATGFVLNYSGTAITVTDGTTVDLTITNGDITAEVIDGSITPAKLDRTYLETEVDGDVTNELQDAVEVPYDNVTSGLTATDAQAAIDELAAQPDNVDDADNDSANEVNTGFAVNTGNLEITDSGGTLPVAVTDIAPVQVVENTVTDDGIVVILTGSTVSVTFDSSELATVTGAFTSDQADTAAGVAGVASGKMYKWDTGNSISAMFKK